VLQHDSDQRVVKADFKRRGGNNHVRTPIDTGIAPGGAPDYEPRCERPSHGLWQSPTLAIRVARAALLISLRWYAGRIHGAHHCQGLPLPVRLTPTIISFGVAQIVEEPMGDVEIVGKGEDATPAAALRPAIC
jgi:hypothetical protein